MKLPSIKILISFVVLVFDFFFLIGLFFFDIPLENRDLVNVLLGATIGWSGNIVSHYFDESKVKG